MSKSINIITSRLQDGAKWVLASNALTFPAQYINVILLGRLSPETLGVYQSFRLLARIFPALAMFGGQRALMTFLPKMKDCEETKDFIWSYSLLFVSVTAVLVIILATFPGLLCRLVVGKNRLTYSVLICIFVVLICTREFVGTSLFSLMKYREGILVRRMPLLIMTLVFGFLYLFYRDYFSANYYPLILGTFIAVGLVGTAIGAWSLKSSGTYGRGQIFFPKSFWKTGLALFLVSALSLVKADIDRYLVWARLDLKDLGYYCSCVTIFLALRYFPQSLGSVFLVNFSSMIGSQQRQELCEVYKLAFRKLALVVSLASLFVSSYSPYILLIYGREYTPYAPLLILLSLRSVIIVPSLLNSPLIVSGEKVVFRIVYDIAELVITAGTILILASSLGLIGVPIGRLLCSAVMEGAGIAYVSRVFQIMFPFSFFAYIFVQCINCTAMLLLPRSLIISSTVFILSLALLVLTKATTLTEIRRSLLVLPLSVVRTGR